MTMSEYKRQEMEATQVVAILNFMVGVANLILLVCVLVLVTNSSPSRTSGVVSCGPHESFNAIYGPHASVLGANVIGGRCVPLHAAPPTSPPPKPCASNEYFDAGRCVPIPPATPATTAPPNLCAPGDHMFFGRCIPTHLEYANIETMVKCAPNEAKMGLVKNRMGKIVAEDCMPLTSQ